MGIQPFFSDNPVLNTDSTLTVEQFLSIREVQTSWINEYRSGLNSDLDFVNFRDHQFMEWIYEDFLEPDVGFLANEWGLDINEVNRILSNLQPHMRMGVPGFYHRKDIDLLAPFAVIRVPDSGRERSDLEPNFFE